jgi:FtsH-binding integral membrane protein
MPTNYLTPNGNYNVYKELVDPDGVKALVSDEQRRLQQKGNVINGLYETKIRLDHYTESNTLRKNAYWRMGMSLVLAVAACFALVILQKYFPIIPSMLIDVLIISLFAGSIIYSLNSYVNIQQRELTDFNKMRLDPPTLDEKKKSESSTALLSGTLSIDNANDCVGNACCPPGMTFSTGNNRCEGFTTLASYSVVKPYYMMPTFSVAL